VKNYGNESEAFKNLRNLTSTEYISKETFLPVRSETELTFQDEDETAGFKIKVYTNYRDINNITEIKLPEETEYYIEERYMIRRNARQPTAYLITLIKIIIQTRFIKWTLHQV
jgi:hypothetical protein